jgi:hypothetical protein
MAASCQELPSHQNRRSALSCTVAPPRATRLTIPGDAGGEATCPPDSGSSGAEGCLVDATAGGALRLVVGTAAAVCG